MFYSPTRFHFYTYHSPLAKESFHLEPVPLLLEFIHGILESEILNSNGSKTNTRVCMDIYPRSVHRHSGQLNLFSGYMNKTWSYGQLAHTAICSELLTVQKRGHGWEQNVDCTQADSLHNIMLYSGTIRSPIFSNSILDFRTLWRYICQAEG